MGVRQSDASDPVKRRAAHSGIVLASFRLFEGIAGPICIVLIDFDPQDVGRIE
jgi:hypothetical protein